jgi:hypothetical protein
VNAPEVQQRGSYFRFVWGDEEVAADVRRVRESGDHVRAEVTWRSIAPGEPPHLHSSVLSLTSASAKASIAKSLQEVHREKPWARIIEQLTHTVVCLYRRGEPIVALRTTGEQPRRATLSVEPFIYEGLPFVFFGEPGSGKSYIAVLVAALAATGSRIPGVPFAAQRVYTPLYLDWESHEDDLRNRVRRLESGLGESLDARIHYRFCAGPLARSVDQIVESTTELSPDLVVIDSLGPGAGGDLNSPQSAQEFFEALRQLRCTSIILAHCAKNGDPRSRSIFGSQFFTAHARGVAEVKRFQEPGEDEILLGIYHRKSNVSRRCKPFGLRLRFDGEDGPVTFGWQDLRDVPSLAASLSVGDRITNALRSGALAPAEIAKATGIPGGTVRKELARLCNKNRAIKLEDGRYGVRDWEEEDVPL